MSAETICLPDAEDADMLTVRHRLASGDLSSMWEYDPVRRLIFLVTRLGSAAPIDFEIAVCAIDRPRLGAHPLMRLDAECWKILPARFAPISETDARLWPRECRSSPNDKPEHAQCSLHEALGTGSHIVLTNAAADVAAELELL